MHDGLGVGLGVEGLNRKDYEVEWSCLEGEGAVMEEMMMSLYGGGFKSPPQPGCGIGFRTCIDATEEESSKLLIVSQ
jgi:hypothetical protein